MRTVLYAGLVRFGALPASSAETRRLRAAVVTAVAVFALGVAWEMVEWAMDGMLGTNFSQGSADTVTDLLDDAIAGAASGALVALWLRAAAGRPGLRLLITSPRDCLPPPPQHHSA